MNLFEGALSVIGPCRAPQLFVLRANAILSKPQFEYISDVWDRAGGSSFGKLIVLDAGMDLRCISDDALKELGYVRIEP